MDYKDVTPGFHFRVFFYENHLTNTIFKVAPDKCFLKTGMKIDFLGRDTWHEMITVDRREKWAECGKKALRTHRAL